MITLNPAAWLKRLRPAAKKRGDTFCSIPFQMLNVMPQGTVKPCCAYSGQVDKDDRPMSVYQQPFEEIWNSKTMRDLRRALDKGEEPAACGYCFRREDLGLESMRQFTAKLTAKRGGDTSELRARSAANGYLAPAPVALDLDLGNLCNLKCRMCHSQSSSAIAADPVHARWAPPGLGAARWRGGEAVIAPARVVGVEYEGVGWPEQRGEVATAWTEREAVVRVDASDIDLCGLSIRLSEERPDGHPFFLSANGRTLFDGALPAGAWSREFDLTPFSGEPRLELRLRSGASVRAGGGRAGVGIEELRLRRSGVRANAVTFSRFPQGAEWFREKELLYGEILKEPGRLQHLHMIGGEPQLIKEVREVMRHLVDVGAAEGINLYMTTNASFVNDEWAELAAKFKSVTIAVSVDGLARAQEYIRYPAKWSDLEMNLPRLRGLPNSDVYHHTTIQAYNMLEISDLARHCDEIGLELKHHVLESPAHLGALKMPAPIRLEAARRLRAYAAGGGKNADSFAEVVHALEAARGVDEALVREFMTFTNDMDASRGQNFAATFPELKERLAAAGFDWTEQRRYA